MTRSIKPVRKAVLPVAGLGTRVLPASKVIPKEMLPVFDRPAIAWVIEEAKDAGIEHFVFVTGRNKDAIADYFDHAYEIEDTLAEKGDGKTLAAAQRDVLPPGAASFVRQQMPKGLGHAIGCARAIIGDEPFAVLLPDVLAPGVLGQCVAAYNRVGGNILAVEQVPEHRVSKFGIIDPVAGDGPLLKMRGMVEKPKVGTAPSNLAITGRYILQPEIFECLDHVTPGAGGEIQLTDGMAALMQKQDFHGLTFAGESFDCGDKVGLLRASVIFALNTPEWADEARAAITNVLARPQRG